MPRPSSRSFVALLAALISLVTRAPVTAEVTAEKSPQGVVVKADGQPFAEYVVKSGSKPIVWPIYGPTGKRMTQLATRDQRAGRLRDRRHQHLSRQAEAHFMRLP